MRRTAALLALAALAAIAVSASRGGSGAVHARSPAGWATAPELRWLTRLGRFGSALGGEVTAQRLAALAACGTRFRTTVGQPPTPRLAAAYRAVAASCVLLARYAGDHDPRALAQARAFAGRGGLDALLGIRRTLPTLSAAQAEPGGRVVSHVDPLYVKAATAVAGKPVAVRCWSDADWTRLLDETAALEFTTRDSTHEILGFTVVGTTLVNLSPTVCSDLDLYELSQGGAMPWPGPTLGVEAPVALTHEAEHARGILGEAQAQCYAIQTVPVTARILGLPPAAARRMAVTAWHDYASEPAIYHSPQCRNGGRFDLHPHSPMWP